MTPPGPPTDGTMLSVSPGCGRLILKALMSSSFQCRSRLRGVLTLRGAVEG